MIEFAFNLEPAMLKNYTKMNLNFGLNEKYHCALLLCPTIKCHPKINSHRLCDCDRDFFSFSSYFG